MSYTPYWFRTKRKATFLNNATRYCTEEEYTIRIVGDSNHGDVKSAEVIGRRIEPARTERVRGFGVTELERPYVSSHYGN